MSFVNVLQEWNDGILRGAQAKLARKLIVSRVTVLHWCQMQLRPSEIQIKKMAKLFCKTEEEIKNLFEKIKKQKHVDNGHKVGDDNDGYVKQSGDIYYNTQRLDQYREVLKQRLDKIEATYNNLETQHKLLEAKLDLILEKLKK
jgi:transcriptional regulator with XRE-family HTH domain